MTDPDIRWIQRLNHYNQALNELKKAVELAQQRPLSDLEEQGLIQAFEYTHELAWNVMKDFLATRSTLNLFGSKDTTREAFKRGLIEQGQVWMDMIRDRNLTSHTYDHNVATQIAAAILKSYYAEFEKLRVTLETFKQEEQK